MLENAKKPQKSEEAATKIAMHAAAMNPLYLRAAVVPQEIREGVEAEGEKKWKKYVTDYCLEEQDLCVVDDNVSVGKYLKHFGGGASLKEFSLISFQ